MNTLFGILHHPLTHRIGWALLHSLWQGALVGAVFALVRFALPNRSANARYVAGCLSLGLLSAFPVLTLLVGPLPSVAPDSEAPALSAFQIAAVPALSLANTQSSHDGNATSSFWHQSAAILGQAAPLLAAAWLLGVAFFSARLTRSWWWVRNIRHRDNKPLDPPWMETLNGLRRRLGVSRPVCLLKSALVEVPTVIGWFHPVILLPATTITGLTPGQLEALLAHELAHVRRLDYVVNAFQCVVETLMFYHPVAWWISRSIREERENCCDDLVIQVCGDRLAYARALATMEGLRGKLPDLVPAASGGSLLNRIRRLLGVQSDNGSVSARQVGGLALMGTCLLSIILLIVAWAFMTRGSEPRYQGSSLSMWVADLDAKKAGDVRERATIVLTEAAREAAPRFIQTLRATLKQGTALGFLTADERRREAVAEFVRFSVGAVPVVTNLLDDPALAGMAINLLCGSCLASVDPLISALDHTNASVRMHAALGLDALYVNCVRFNNYKLMQAPGWSGNYPTNAAVAAIVKLLKEESPDTRGAAAFALGDMREQPESVIPALTECLAVTTESEVRQALAEALGKYGRRAVAAVSALKQLMDDSAPAVRAAAKRALKKIDAREQKGSKQ